MSEHDFTSVRNQLMQLYNEKAYAQALNLVQREAANFPQQGVLYHWRMCLFARLNDPVQAVQAFREALDHGYSYPSALVRDDEDLQSLQGLTEYEQLVGLSLQRFAEAEANTKPELLVIQPEDKGSEPAPLLLALHGNSQNARLAANDWRPMHAKGWMLAFPQSSQLLMPDAYIWNDFARGTDEMQRLYSTLTSEYAIDPERVILGGFSMGGGLAIQLAVTGTIKTRGFVVVGPYLPDLEPLTPFLETARANGLRGYIVMGLQEPPEGQELMRKISAFLNEQGIPCELEERPDIAHAFPPDFERSLEKALAFLLQG